MRNKRSATSALQYKQPPNGEADFQEFAPLKLVGPRSQPLNAADVAAPNVLSEPPQNAILKHLPFDVWLRVREYIGHSLLTQGHSLIEQGQYCDQIYFPTSGLVSQVLSSPCGSRVSTGLVGCEGMLGLIEGFNQTPAMTHSIVQVSGTTCSLPAEILRQEFQRGGALQHWFLRYMQWQMVQTSQNVLCNSVHSVEERVARLLLAAQDRMRATWVTATHEDIATLLGTRRCIVTVTMGRFEKSGLIECGRGRFRVQDAPSLEKYSCICYRSLRHQAVELRMT